MTDEEFRAWLQDEVNNGRMLPGQMYDLLDQKVLFAQNFGSEDDPQPRRGNYRLKIVGYVAGQLRVASEIHALINSARSEFPHRMIYFEPIGFDLF